MSIQRKPKTTPQEFISGAPDHKNKIVAEEPYNRGVAKGNRRQITHTIEPELLRKVDQMAKKIGQTRAGFINMALYRAVDGDPFAV